MRKYCRIIYFFVMAALILSLSGCEWDDDNNKKKNSRAASTEDKLIVITSPAFKQDESYMIYRGDKVRIAGTNAKYYVAPLADNDTPVTMNLLFKDVISEDLPFVITTADADYAVVVAYNPGGTTFSDYTTEYGSVIRAGGGQQKLHYGGLTVAGASVGAASLGFDKTNETVINLEESMASIISGDEDVPIEEFYFVWHADPSHRHEYYTKDLNGEEITKGAMFSEIFHIEDLYDDDYWEEFEDWEYGDYEDAGGEKVIAYVAHDIRYTTNDLNFEGLISADGKTEYVAYYHESVASEAAEELGEGFYGPYIFATLPSMNITASEDAEGEEDGESEVSSALNNSEVDTFRRMTHTADDAYNYPVLHIIKPGTYRLKGTWLGQIMLDPGISNDITVILDGVTISCDVAPAIVFGNVRECENEYNASFDVGSDLKYDAGAKLIIANRSVNSIYGSNVYRIFAADKRDDNVTAINGTDINQQKQLYKLDGAISSYVSLAVGAENNSGGGKLSIRSKSYGGLCSDTHLLLDGGTVTVSAMGDGISANGYDSVFTMNSGNLTVISRKGDGIYSGSDIVINNGVMDITAAKDSDSLNSEETGPMRAVNDVYVSENVTYSHQAYAPDENGEEEEPNENGGDDETGKTMTKQPVTVHDTSGAVLLRINYTTPVKDEDEDERTISTSGYVFTLERRVNSFSNITGEEE